MKIPPSTDMVPGGARLEEIGNLLEQMHVVDTDDLPNGYIVPSSRTSQGVFIRSGRGSKLLNFASRSIVVILLVAIGAAGWGVHKIWTSLRDRGATTGSAISARDVVGGENQAAVKFTVSCQANRINRGIISGHLRELSQGRAVGSASQWKDSASASGTYRVARLPEGTVTQMLVDGKVGAVALALRQSAELCVAMQATGLLDGGGRLTVDNSGVVGGDIGEGVVRVLSEDGGRHVSLVQLEP